MQYAFGWHYLMHNKHTQPNRGFRTAIIMQKIATGPKVSPCQWRDFNENAICFQKFTIPDIRTPVWCHYLSKLALQWILKPINTRKLLQKGPLSVTWCILISHCSSPFICQLFKNRARSGISFGLYIFISSFSFIQATLTARSADAVLRNLNWYIKCQQSKQMKITTKLRGRGKCL